MLARGGGGSWGVGGWVVGGGGGRFGGGAPRESERPVRARRSNFTLKRKLDGGRVGVGGGGMLQLVTFGAFLNQPVGS